MSGTYMYLIPTDPSFVPNAAARKQAVSLFTSFLPKADEVIGEVTNDIEFINAGENFESVICPFCKTILTSDHTDPGHDEWWSDAMDAAYEKSHFRDLSIVVPCCKTKTNLNDLMYDWRQGFARFTLKARNPDILDLPPDQMSALEEILGCSLRLIWRRI